jgi:hypothetical protein
LALLKSPRATCRLEEIVITPELKRRPARASSLTRENQALHKLARSLTDPPDELIASLLRVALDLCDAESAGLSMLEAGPGGEEVFRWAAIVGKWKSYVGGSLPRHASPCGITVDARAPQLFRGPERYFNYADSAQPAIAEALVVPIFVGETIPGTIWIVAHSDKVQFDLEDVRLLESLGAFAAHATLRKHCGGN